MKVKVRDIIGDEEVEVPDGMFTTTWIFFCENQHVEDPEREHFDTSGPRGQSWVQRKGLVECMITLNELEFMNQFDPEDSD